MFSHFLLASLLIPNLVEAHSRCEKACNNLSSALPYSVFRRSPTNLWSKFQTEVTPQCTVEPSTSEEVAEILTIAKTNQCHFAVLAGGTSPFRYASSADGGITINMNRMRWVEVDEDLMQVKVGAGAIWEDVYRKLGPKNMSATGTRNARNGVTGSILGGGISFFSQRFGWSCDTVVAFEVVLANSTAVNVTESSSPDLFFALRGGGNNFGIVTSVTLETFKGPPSWYSFQLWDIGILGVLFQRLQDVIAKIPDKVWQTSVTLAWHVPTQEFVVSERTVASDLPDLWSSVRFPGTELRGRSSMALRTLTYQRSTLDMARKMDEMNPSGFYNYFGSITVTNDAKVFLALAGLFFEEVMHVQKVSGLRVNIVFNPLTVETIRKMQTRGGNALGVRVEDGPLMVVNLNLHWSGASDIPKMTTFMRRIIRRFRNKAEEIGMLHRYIFQNHAFEEQDVFAGYGDVNLGRLKRIRENIDPDGVFQKLQPGYFKLCEDDGRDVKLEL